MLYCFIGLESFNWGIADFEVAAEKIKANGYDTVVFKVGEGPRNLWYMDAVMRAIIRAFNAQGIQAIPYIFLWGNSQGSNVDEEANLSNHVLGVAGQVCLDMESGFDGKPQDAERLASLLHSGKIHVSTWANLEDHNYVEVAAKLMPKVTSWWPQVYTNYLAGVWHTQNRTVPVPIYPTFAQATMPRGAVKDMGYWEYGSIFKVQGPPPAPKQDFTMEIKRNNNPNPAMQKQADALFNPFNLTIGKQPLSRHTGIGELWSQTTYNARCLGAVLSEELETVDWNDKKVLVQIFSGGHIFWDENGATPQGRIFVSGIGELIHRN